VAIEQLQFLILKTLFYSLLLQVQQLEQHSHTFSKTLFHTFLTGSGDRTIDGSLNLKPYATISHNLKVTHEENVVGFVET